MSKNRGRPAKAVEYKGRSQSMSAWAKEVGISVGTLYSRIKSLGWDIERALSTPVRPRNMAMA